MCAHEVASSSATSLFEEALKEAQRHRWIESEKQGRDLGEQAIRDWYHRHWRAYCRHKRLEHVAGRKRWKEFDDEPFGAGFCIAPQCDLLTDRVLDRVYAGYENLEIINWAIAWGLPTERVVECLALLDVNRARLEPISP